MPQLPAYAIAHDRGPDSTTDDETDARLLSGWCIHVAGTFAGTFAGKVHRDAGPRRTTTGAHSTIEVSVVPHANRGGQHRSRRDQAERTRRPLRRRADKIARPARVRMRSRNPCVRARRRLFGWNVRLLTMAPERVTQ